MNALTISGGNAANMTMSSREIAELTGKRHEVVSHFEIINLDDRHSYSYA
jgi:phage regulator Rha-like protein